MTQSSTFRVHNMALGIPRALVLLGLWIVPRAGAQAPDPERAALIAEAEQALSLGKSHAATRLLTPLLRATVSPDPGPVLLAARAAAGWEGWGLVVELLAGRQWLDSVEGGEGRALLARARVERSEPAVEDARDALGTATAASLASRLVVLARAFDRADQLDSAAVRYLAAAAELPPAADWLRLRAAGLIADSGTRAALFQTITLPAATRRIGWTEALARSRTKDYAGAARRYAGLGAPLPALRMRREAAATDAERAALRRDLLALIPGIGGEDRRAAIGLLDGLGSRSPAEELIVARRAAGVDPRRAVDGFARAASAGSLTDADRLGYGSALARLGRHREALPVFSAVRSAEVLAQARYQRARSLLSLGRRGDAVLALREIFRSMPGGRDSTTFATAGYLAAELLVDHDLDTAARYLYRDVARRFPRTAHGPRAAFQAAIIAWAAGNRDEAQAEFAALADQAREHGERAAALYWSGRALWERRDTAAAAERWRTVLRRYPSSYYAMRAAQRLGMPVAPAHPAISPAPADSILRVGFDRAALLEQLGLRVEARFEYDYLARIGQSDSAGRMGVAQLFLERGQVGRAFRLAQPAGEAAPRRMAWPLSEIPFLLEEAERAGVDARLGAALIRQESAYELSARSRADARGWMQIMPPLGASLARGAGISGWYTDLLHQPEINLRFGMSHLATVLRRYPDLPVALAAYNAGWRAAERWAGFAGAREDSEVFIERIQYVETRDYVRRVLRNYAVYQELFKRSQSN